MERAEYEDGKWKLSGDWSILNYPREEARALIARGKEYLENLLRPLDSNYAAVSFRSGSWCIAPSLFMLQLLAEFGIVFDMSIGRRRPATNDAAHQTRLLELRRRFPAVLPGE
jgi:hypothetical protein